MKRLFDHPENLLMAVESVHNNSSPKRESFRNLNNHSLNNSRFSNLNSHSITHVTDYTVHPVSSQRKLPALRLKANHHNASKNFISSGTHTTLQSPRS
jgi:hypothetical protein